MNIVFPFFNFFKNFSIICRPLLEHWCGNNVSFRAWGGFRLRWWWRGKQRFFFFFLRNSMEGWDCMWVFCCHMPQAIVWIYSWCAFPCSFYFLILLHKCSQNFLQFVFLWSFRLPFLFSFLLVEGWPWSWKLWAFFGHQINSWQ